MEENKNVYYHQLGDQLFEEYHPLYTLLIETRELLTANLVDSQSILLNGSAYKLENQTVYRNGDILELGETVFGEEKVTLLESEKEIFTTYIFAPTELFICSSQEEADLKISSSTVLIFSDKQVQIEIGDRPVYLNYKLIEESGLFPFEIGDMIATAQHFIEKRKLQWKISSLYSIPIFNLEKILVEECASEYPQFISKSDCPCTWDVRNYSF